MDDCSTAAADESGLLWARFLDDGSGLLAVEVSVPVPVALAMLDVLDRFGVCLTNCEVHKCDGWVRQRLSLTERDGTLVGRERRLRLQQEVLTLLGEP